MVDRPHWGICPSCKRERPLAVISNGKCDLERIETERLEAVKVFAARQINMGWDGPRGDAVRQERNQKLDQTMWAVMPGTPLSQECQDEFCLYREKLHRLTVDFQTPGVVIWPDQPTLVYN